MHIFRGIRMVVVRMMMRATCHCEVRATCFPEGGVPTVGMRILGLDLPEKKQSSHQSFHQKRR